MYHRKIEDFQSLFDPTIDKIEENQAIVSTVFVLC